MAVSESGQRSRDAGAAQENFTSVKPLRITQGNAPLPVAGGGHSSGPTPARCRAAPRRSGALRPAPPGTRRDRQSALPSRTTLFKNQTSRAATKPARWARCEPLPRDAAPRDPPPRRARPCAGLTWRRPPGRTIRQGRGSAPRPGANALPSAPRRASPPPHTRGSARAGPAGLRASAPGKALGGRTASGFGASVLPCRPAPHGRIGRAAESPGRLRLRQRGSVSRRRLPLFASRKMVRPSPAPADCREAPSCARPRRGARRGEL